MVRIVVLGSIKEPASLLLLLLQMHAQKSAFEAHQRRVASHMQI